MNTKGAGVLAAVLGACLAASKAGAASAREDFTEEISSLGAAFSTASGAARAGVDEMLAMRALRVAAAAAPDETGLIDIPVRAVGGGASESFVKSQCLFCVRYREQAETMAKERAKANAEALCGQKRGFLSREPEAEVTDCVRVDGWTSYYLCGARAWGVCRAPIP